MAKLAPFGPFRALDGEGNPLAGGKLFTYEAGTASEKDTYTDADGGTANTNPVILDSEGYANVWLGTGAYKFILKDSTDVTLWTINDITGESENAFGATVTDQATNLNVNTSHNNAFINATAAITVSLLPASTAGEGFYLTVKASNGDVIVDPDGAETIDGAATVTIEDGRSALIISNGTNWFSAFLGTNTFSGSVTVSGTSSAAASLILGEDTDNGVNTVTVSAPAAITSNRTQTLQDADGTIPLIAADGSITVAGVAAGPASLILGEDTDNGAHTVKVIAPSAVTANRTQTLQDADGTVALTSNIKTFASGTYTPTISNGANVAASTASVTNYVQYDSYVTVFGRINIDPTATATYTDLGVSLPIASDFANVYDLSGYCINYSASGQNTLAIFADAANNRATIAGYANGSNANDPYSFTFTYKVI